jgi:hypothetical protein
MPVSTSTRQPVTIGDPISVILKESRTMHYGRCITIPLDPIPSPDGENRLDIDIRERFASATYFSSTREAGGGRYVTILFTNYFACRYFVTEDHETLCPGISEAESEFVEIQDSAWIPSLPTHVHGMKHYVLAINRSLFECIADEFEIQRLPK